MTDSVPPSERRVAERFFACFPASLVRPDGEQRPSLIRDLSVSGALLLVYTSKLKVGDFVKLRLHLSDDPTAYRPANARVVRVEKLDPQDAGPWLRRVAVQFDEPVSVNEADIESFKQRARSLGRPE